MSGGTGNIYALGYLQSEANRMRDEREMFAQHLSVILDDEGVSMAVAEVDRRARETLLSWSAASRQVAHEIAAGEAAW